MSRRQAIRLGVVMIVLLQLGLIATTQNVRMGSMIGTADELQKMRLEAARRMATPIQEGVMTPQQREHSKLYPQYHCGQKIRDLFGDHEYIAINRSSSHSGSGSGQPAFNLDAFLVEAAAKADAVVIGMVRSHSSQLTEDGEFLFTDYTFAVTEVLKDNPADHFGPSGLITITRPGGVVRLEGYLVEEVDKAYQLFHEGPEYLLFLKYIPATGSYRSLNSTTGFGLIEDRVIKLTNEEIPPVIRPDNLISGLSRDGVWLIHPDNFVRDVRSAVAAVSGEKPGQAK